MTVSVCIYNMHMDTNTLICGNICVQMQPELRRYIQHISLSPDSINNDDVRPQMLFYTTFASAEPEATALT